MDLYVIRHADAENAASSDFERRLTDKGRKQSERLGQFLARQRVKPTRILTSPLVRAVETAVILARELSAESQIVQDDRLACGMSPDEAYAALWEQEIRGGTAFVVGHQPDLSRLCADLVGIADSGGIEMKKAACARFSLTQPGRGEAVLDWLLPPKVHARG